MIGPRLRSTAHQLSSGAGMFGWTAIQVHVKVVNKQLQIMVHIDLVPNILGLRMKTDGGTSSGMSEGVGRAKTTEGYSKVKRVILSAGGTSKPRSYTYVYWLHSQTIDCAYGWPSLPAECTPAWYL